MSDPSVTGADRPTRAIWLRAVEGELHQQLEAGVNRSVVTGRLGVLLAVAVEMRSDGTRAVASMETIRRRALLSERSVTKVLTWALDEKAPFLERTERGHRRGNGVAMASVYAASLPDMHAANLRVEDDLYTQPPLVQDVSAPASTRNQHAANDVALSLSLRERDSLSPEELKMRLDQLTIDVVEAAARVGKVWTSSAVRHQLRKMLDDGTPMEPLRARALLAAATVDGRYKAPPSIAWALPRPRPPRRATVADPQPQPWCGKCDRASYRYLVDEEGRNPRACPNCHQSRVPVPA